MYHILKVIIVILLITSYTIPGRGMSSPQQTYDEKIQQLIQNGQYVDAYLYLSEQEEKSASGNAKLCNDFIMCKVLKKAYQETNETYYLSKYIHTLHDFCTYNLTNGSVINQTFSDPIWKLTHELTQYYTNTKDEEIKEIYELIRDNEIELRESAFPVIYDYCNYEFQRGYYTSGAFALRTFLGKLNKDGVSNTLVAKAMHLSAIAQLINVDALKEDEFYTDEIRYYLEQAGELYKRINTEESQIQQIHLKGDYAIYHFCIGERKKAYDCLAKEEQGITQRCGTGCLEYAWFLFHKAQLDLLSDQTNKAKQSLIKAMNLYHMHAVDFIHSHRYILIKRWYKRCLSFQEWGENKSFRYPLSYYQHRLNRIASELNSTNAKMVELTDIQLNLEYFKPFPTQTYTKCISMIGRLAINNRDTNEEIVSIPSDFKAMNELLGTDSNISSQALNSLMHGGHFSTAKLSILGGLQLLNKKHALNKDNSAKLMDLYAEIGLLQKNWDEALKSLAVAISLKNPKEIGYSRLAERLAKMAYCYQEQGQIESCRAIISEAARLLSNMKPGEMGPGEEDFLSLSKAYTLISKIYANLGESAKSKVFADRAISVSKKNFQTLPYYNLAASCKAKTLYKEGRFDECASLLLPLKSMNLRNQLIDNYNHLLINALCDIGDKRAIGILEEYMKYSTRELIPLYFTKRSQFERDSLWSMKSANMIHLNMKVALTFPTNEIKRTTYNNIIYAKSLDTQFNVLLKETVEKGDEFVKGAYAQLISSQDSLHFGSPQHVLWHKNNIAFAQSVLPAAMTQDCLKRLQNKNFFKSFSTLGPHTAMVEFVTFSEENHTTYYALITHNNDDAPAIVKIATNDELAALYDNTPAHVNKLYDKNDYLYTHLWQKIEKHLHVGIKNIVIVPTGVFNRINFNAIPTRHGILADSFNMIRVTNLVSFSSTRTVRRTNRNIDIALFGNIQYDMTKDSIIKESTNHLRNSEPIYRSLRTTRDQLTPLTYGNFELSRIRKVFEDTPLKLKEYTGTKASEGAFKDFSGRSPRIIHITTHGFYLKEKKSKHHFYNDTQGFNYRGQSLLYNGLLMAGAQHAWNGKELPVGVDDGILTADEISRLDLSGTQMVVLSACETALGDIDDTEGVLGLQRAFKRAGVRYVLMSLWPVNDESSAYFMVNFYRALQTEKNVSTVLRLAMKATAKRFPKPADWAGFVLLR